MAAASPRVCRAQRTATLGAGASYVKYDGFLGAGAASLSGVVSWRTPLASFGIRGTVLAFETGHASVQAAIAGAALTPRFSGTPFRFELAGEASASSYVSYAQFSHLLATGRLHAGGPDADVWMGPEAAFIGTNAGSGTAAGLAAGGAARVPDGMLMLTLGRRAVGDTAWSDGTAALKLLFGTVELDASAGARFASRGAGQGGYGDATISWRFSQAAALVLAGGRYPSDPVRGTIAGSYLTLGLELRQHAPVRAISVASIGRGIVSPPDTTGAGSAAAAVTVDAVGGMSRISITAPAARRVEIMGDFTDWLPVELSAAPGGRFRFEAMLTRGIYHYNIRVEGGPWVVPAGADSAADEFGSRSALLVVP